MSQTPTQPAALEAIRPFTIDVSDEQLEDLRNRIKATRWPDREVDPSQGVQLETIQALAEYWATDYDWRKFEERFAALPHFITEIDGVDIHFIHVRSKHEDALPLIVTHGWPGSTVEQLKIIDPLTDPKAHGAERGGRFPPRDPVPAGPRVFRQADRDRLGPDPDRAGLGRADERLGYTQYVAQGGDWGNAVTEQLALLKPEGLLGIHTNMPATVPPDVSQALASGGPKPDGLAPDEDEAFEILKHFFATGVGYASEMANRPQTLYGIVDSPVGLAAWMLDHDVRQLRAHRARLRRRAGRPLARRRARQRHPLLADEHGDLLGAPLLGEPSAVLRHQGRRAPGRRDRLPGRALSSSEELGGAGLSQAHPLQQGGRRAGISPPGSSRRCFPRRCAQTFRSLR